VRTALNLAVSRWRVRRREVLADPTTLRRNLRVADVESAGFDPGLAAAVQRLPRRQREVLTLRLLVDLDTATTAQLLGISPGAVTAHLHRATATLRENLTPLTTEEHTPLVATGPATAPAGQRWGAARELARCRVSCRGGQR
jgi:DNA-directed RNA polymerase specialized sigma24 family protein